MARLKKQIPKQVLGAEIRLAGLKSIDPALDLDAAFGRKKGSGVSWFVTDSPDTIRRWKDPAIADNQFDKLALQPTV